MLAAKMSGSIKEVGLEDLRSKLQDFAELIDSYDVGSILSDDKQESVQQSYIEQYMDNKLIAQTVIGKNYRVNIYEDDSIEATFIKSNISNYTFNEYVESLNELKFEHRTTQSTKHGTMQIKSVVSISADKEAEDIMSLLFLFKIF